MRKLDKILYVEDEEDIRSVAILALESVGGFQVLPCASGQQALDVGESFGPDLILLDVMMPDMDGPTTLENLRKIPSLKEVPAIFMTAKVQRHEIDEYLAAGAVGVIAKPFDPMSLAADITAKWAASLAAA